ncbi:hypothetical protein P8452_38151 [Trifolium repens]|nr:hypothetical protein P8452_38151 [Trifolium repens]
MKRRKLDPSFSCNWWFLFSSNWWWDCGFNLYVILVESGERQSNFIGIALSLSSTRLCRVIFKGICPPMSRFLKTHKRNFGASVDNRPGATYMTNLNKNLRLRSWGLLCCQLEF